MLALAHTKGNRSALTRLSATLAPNVGLVGQNTYEIARLKNSATQLGRQMNSVGSNLTQLTDSLNRVASRVNQPSDVVIPDIEREIRELVKSISRRTAMGEIAGLTRYRLSAVTSKISGIVNSLLQNKIIPELLSPDTVRNKILSRPDMKDSLYQDDIQLIYQLSQGVLVSIRYDPFILGAIIVTPKIMREHIGITLSVTKVPILHNHSDTPTIIDTPDLILQDTDKGRVWATDFTRCKSVAGVYFCSIQVLHQKTSECLQNLIFSNDSSRCIRRDSYDNPMERLTLSGILITSRDIEIKEIVKDKDGHNKALTVERSSDNSFFISGKEVSEVIVGSTIYLLRERPIEVNPVYIYNKRNKSIRIHIHTCI